jgi:hypothetical protein
LNVRKNYLKKIIWEVIRMLIFFLPFGPLITLLAGPLLVFALATGMVPKLIIAIIFAILF